VAAARQKNMGAHAAGQTDQDRFGFLPLIR
jgi:hypothetical protein